MKLLLLEVGKVDYCLFHMVQSNTMKEVFLLSKIIPSWNVQITCPFKMSWPHSPTPPFLELFLLFLYLHPSGQ